MLFSRVGGFIARRRASRRDNAGIGARAGLSLTDDIPVSTAQSIIGGGGEGDSAVAVARDVVIGDPKPLTLNPKLYLQTLRPKLLIIILNPTF
jgi:hypothetical protein